jgi:hypothetical protein
MAESNSGPGFATKDALIGPYCSHRGRLEAPRQAEPCGAGQSILSESLSLYLAAIRPGILFAITVLFLL